MVRQGLGGWPVMNLYQWSFLVPLMGGRYHIIPQLAVFFHLYTTYIFPSGWLYNLYITYHLLREQSKRLLIITGRCKTPGTPWQVIEFSSGDECSFLPRTRHGIVVFSVGERWRRGRGVKGTQKLVGYHDYVPGTFPRWWFQHMFYFMYIYIYIYLGKWSNLTNVFHMGWKHHLVSY